MVFVIHRSTTSQSLSIAQVQPPQGGALEVSAASVQGFGELEQAAANAATDINSLGTQVNANSPICTWLGKLRFRKAIADLPRVFYDLRTH